MAMPKVSIIIPVYNGANYLAEAIDSALMQDYPNKEILVINDGSTDQGQTAAIARSYGDKIRYYEKPNGGVATALNMGIEKMTGDYFSWLSHDDLYLPQKLSHQMRLIQKSGNPTQIVAGGYYITNSKLQPLGLMDFHRLYTKEELSRPLFPVFHCAVNGCTLLIHKSHFERVGMFREDLPTTQDYDLWFRMLRGQRLCYAQAIDVISRAHEKQTSRSTEKEHTKECEDLWMRLFNELSPQECAAISGSKELFYADTYNHFANYTSYEKIVDYLKEKNTITGYHAIYRGNRGRLTLTKRCQLRWKIWKLKQKI